MLMRNSKFVLKTAKTCKLGYYRFKVEQNKQVRPLCASVQEEQCTQLNVDLLTTDAVAVAGDALDSSTWVDEISCT
jgi:hypothetical protein